MKEGAYILYCIYWSTMDYKKYTSNREKWAENGEKKIITKMIRMMFA